MKKIIIFSVLFLSAFLSLNIASAYNPAFNLTARNFIYTDSIGAGGGAFDAITFDIYIEHTNIGSSGPFEFSLGQYYFNINGALGVTADYSYYIIPGSTEFTNPNAIPRNPAFVSPDAGSPEGASLRLGVNTILGAGNGPIVLYFFPGTRVCTVRLKKKSGSFPDVPLNMVWRTGLPNPVTKVYAYMGTSNVDVSLNGTFIIDNANIPNIKLIFPPDNSVNNTFTVSFKWMKDNRSVAYVYQLYSDSLLTNNLISDTINNNSDTSKTISGLSGNTKYFWRVGGIDAHDHIYYSNVRQFTTSSGMKLNIKIIPEGLYNTLSGQMSRKDTFTVCLRSISSPYLIIDSAKAVVDSVYFSGLFTFINTPDGIYYAALKHFNSIETWSRSGGITMTFADTSFYDFTNSASQAYGSNLVLHGGKYCIYSGDVNQDGITDGSDLMKIFNDSYAGLTGRYLASDLNGDNIADAADLSILDNNVFNGILKITP